MLQKKYKTPARNQSTTRHPSIPSLAWVVILVSLIAVISIRRHGEVNQPPATPAPSTSPIQWKQITNPQVLFFTKIFLQRNKTYISIPLKYESGIQTTWLSLSSSSSAEPSEWLVAHPVLNGLSWSSINDGSVYLYQKTKHYGSLGDFLKNPPLPNQLITDESVTQIDKYKNIKGTQLREQFNLDDFDYILTTYIPAGHQDNELYYSNIIDATDAVVNKNNNLTWELDVPTATDSSPYSIGEIHVDYR